MNKLNLVGVVLGSLAALSGLVACGDDGGQLEWCESIYHRNVGCPLHGQVEIPADVLAQEAAEELEWCDDNYHPGTDCPAHGLVPIPTAIKAERRAAFLEQCEFIDDVDPECEEPSYCDEISHEDVRCPGYATVELPEEIVARRAEELAAWCRASQSQSRFCLELELETCTPDAGVPPTQAE